MGLEWLFDTYGPLLNRESGTFSLIESLHPAFSSALLLIIVQNIMFVVIVWGAAATMRQARAGVACMLVEKRPRGCCNALKPAVC